MTSRPATGFQHSLALAALALLCSFLLWTTWIGFYASDDIYYYEGGKAWITTAWHVPRGFGEVRTTVTLPISLSLLIFGDSEFSAALPTCLYMVGAVLITYWRLSTLVPSSHAFVASVLFATLPVLVLESSFPSADLAELFWITVAFWCFVAATRDGKGNPWTLVAVGVAAALAFTAHETVLAFLLFLGLLFVAGYRISRWRYWIMAIGFLAVIGAEVLYYAVAAGDPFYRFNLAVYGYSVSVDREVVPPFTYDSAGTLRIWAPIDSLVMALTRHNFSIAYYIMIPSIGLLGSLILGRWRARESLPEWMDQAMLAAILGVVWFAFAAAVLYRIALLARYYLPPTYFLLVASSLVISHVVLRWRPLLTASAIALLLAASIAAISVANKSPRGGERAVAAYLMSNPGPLYTDPYTATRSQWFVRWAQQDFGRVTGAPPRLGDRFLYNPQNVTRPNRLLKASDLPLYRPSTAWPVIWKSEVSPPLIGRVLGAMGLAGIFPPTIREKLIDPKPPIIVYQVTTQPPS